MERMVRVVLCLLGASLVLLTVCFPGTVEKTIALQEGDGPDITMRADGSVQTADLSLSDPLLWVVLSVRSAEEQAGLTVMMTLSQGDQVLMSEELSAEGLSLGGMLSFQAPQPLPKGNYRLTITLEGEGCIVLEGAANAQKEQTENAIALTAIVQQTARAAAPAYVGGILFLLACVPGAAKEAKRHG